MPTDQDDIILQNEQLTADLAKGHQTIAKLQSDVDALGSEISRLVQERNSLRAENEVLKSKVADKDLDPNSAQARLLKQVVVEAIKQSNQPRNFTEECRKMVAGKKTTTSNAGKK